MHYVKYHQLLLCFLCDLTTKTFFLLCGLQLQRKAVNNSWVIVGLRTPFDSSLYEEVLKNVARNSAIFVRFVEDSFVISGNISLILIFRSFFQTSLKTLIIKSSRIYDYIRRMLFIAQISHILIRLQGFSFICVFRLYADLLVNSVNN